MARTIELTQGQVTLVDDEDYAELNRHNWFAQRTRHGFFYAFRRDRTRERGKRPTIIMARTILNAPDGLQIDHINGDTLDNRRVNLRLCTQQQNLCNRVKYTDGTSKFKGVYWYKQNRAWRARITVDHKTYSLGCFDSESEAAAAYDKAALELHGEFSRTNGI